LQVQSVAINEMRQKQQLSTGLISLALWQNATVMKTILLSLALGISLILPAQHQNIQLPNSGSPYSVDEPVIFINPKNTDEVIAGSNINNVYVSNDGGYTWAAKVLVSQAYGVWGDPVTIIDTAGHYYFFHLSNPPGGHWIDRIVSQKSTDKGMTWSDGNYMGLNGTKAQDKEWAVVDRTNNNIYVTWTQFDSYGSSDPDCKSIIRFSKSTDGGASWSEAEKINQVDGDCVDSDETVEGAVPAVGPAGEIYVAWAGPAGLVFNRSRDQGETWLEEEIFVNEMPGGWDYSIPGIMRCNGLPVTVCDLSNGPHHGTIYINWTDQRNGLDDTDVWLAKSTDGGDSWSEPVRVNDDPPGSQQFFTWMAVDQVTGYLWFVYYDRREYSNNLTDVYMAVSTDGGENFINFKVNEEAFLPQTNIFFGDYNNVSAHNNVVRSIWTRMHNGQKSIWTAIVDVEEVLTPTYLAEKERMPLASLQPNYPNPFVSTTSIAFKLYQPSVVSIRVYDIFGKEVAVFLHQEFRAAGKYVEHFDASVHNLPAGVYYFALITNGMSFKQKMTLLH